MKKKFARYVSQNIFGMIGISAYILADTYFISVAAGANGITALNLVLPLYSLIFAIGSLLAVGAATQYKIETAKGNLQAGKYFTNALLWATFFGVCFLLIGGLAPEAVVRFMGGTPKIVEIGAPYTRIFMLFAPIFMYNYIFNAFVRNDDNPTLAMIATFSSSIFNVVMDYVLMFPLGMGMKGAALATACSPVVGILICLLHFTSKKNTLRFYRMFPSIKMLWRSITLGVAAFVGEISSGVITMVFNLLLLQIAGNVGVAAYGVIANIAIVAVSIFNGIAQGGQPLLSEAYGANRRQDMKKVYAMSVGLGVICAVGIALVTNGIPGALVAIFNSEENRQLAEYATEGMRLYFLGFLCSGFNIITTSYLSATARAVPAMVGSVLRGFVAITGCAVLLAWLLGMKGVWLAYLCAEAITAVVLIIWMILERDKRDENRI